MYRLRSRWKKEHAIKNYEKFIEINPKNNNGVKMLAKLKVK
jgi:hypothetical protein